MKGIACLFAIVVLLFVVSAGKRDFRLTLPRGYKRGDKYFATRPHKEVGERMRKYDRKKDKTFPFEQGAGYYHQFDIMLRPDVNQNAILPTPGNTNRWTNGIVPYQFIGNFTEANKKNIRTAMDLISAGTCVKFVPYTNQSIYLSIDSVRSGCWSYVGMYWNSKYNLVNLEVPGCMAIGTATHELMHALGFNHEHIRPDRDDWIYINRSALLPFYNTDDFWASAYEKSPAAYSELYGQDYSYSSVMHYSAWAAGADTRYPVLIAKKPWQGAFGNNSGPSPIDIKVINYMYCNSTTVK